MRAALVEKIRALANDERGDPATRARAQEKLDAVRKAHPDLFHEAGIKAKFGGDPRNKPSPPDPRVHGLRRDPAYEYYVFTDLSLWQRTKANNNPTCLLYHKGVVYRIVLFKHKRGDSWGWMRKNTFDDTTEFSGRFRTLGEAHGDAWASLMTKS